MSESVLHLDESTVGSVGSLVGAALESTGHYLQSEVLDIFASGFSTSMGALLYALSLVVGLYLYTMGGNYKHGLWLLIGPAVFLFLTSTRTVSTGTSWHFGERMRDQSEVHEVMKGLPDQDREITTKSGKEVRVSWFFAKWNKLSSNIVQNFVSVVNVTNNYKDVSFEGSVEKYSDVMTAEVTDNRLIKFFQTVVMTRCSRVFVLRQDLYDASKSEGRREIIKKNLEAGLNNQLNQKVVNLSSGEHADILDDLRAQFLVASSGELKEAFSEPLTTGVSPIDANEMRTGHFSCGQLWQLSVVLFKIHAEELLPAIYVNNRDQDIPPIIIRDELLKKFKFESTDGNLKPITQEDELAYRYMVNEMAGRMLVKQFRQVNPNIIMRDLDSKVFEKDVGHNKKSRETARIVRNLHGGVEYTSKGDFFTSMLSLPYMQGLSLYFLSITFPFFCLTVLVPGRQSGVMLWMGLWFWIKSWDFGFAIVMMIGDMLYVLLPHGPPINDGVMADPGLAFKQLLMVDPNYSVYLYYQLMATSLAAVPLLTGVLVQRGGAEIMSAIEQGFQDYGGRVGNAMGQMERAILAGDKGSKARKYMMEEMKSAASDILKKPENAGIKEAFAKAGVMAAAGITGDNFSTSQLQGGLARVSNQAGVDRNLKTAAALYNAALEKHAYNISNSPQMIQLASESVEDGMFSRHYGRIYPGGALLDVIQQAVHPQINSNLDKTLERTVDGTLGDLADLKYQDFGKGAAFLAGAATVGGVTLGASLAQSDREKEFLRSAGNHILGEPSVVETGRRYSNVDMSTQGQNADAEDFDPRRLGSQFSYPLTKREIHTLGENANRLKGGADSKGYAEKYGAMAADIANKAGLDKDQFAIMMSIVSTNSGFNPSYASQTNSGMGLTGWSPDRWVDIRNDMVAQGVVDDNVAAGEYRSRLDPEIALETLAYSMKRHEGIAQHSGWDMSSFEEKYRVYTGLHHDGYERWEKNGVQTRVSDEAGLKEAEEYRGRIE